MFLQAKDKKYKQYNVFYRLIKYYTYMYLVKYSGHNPE